MKSWILKSLLTKEQLEKHARNLELQGHSMMVTLETGDIEVRDSADIPSGIQGKKIKSLFIDEYCEYLKGEKGSD